ncbi:MAG TPA: xanthine dehydrogenase family protein subunit M [Terriglobia bacterium]|nr:xanthine dehydrogenase family protein subunit M [Terriglobia bacterium]
MIPPQFDYYRPQTLSEALAILSEYQEDAKVLAGGQSLISVLKLRLANPRCLVDLGQLEGLRYIREEADGSIAIGAMTTYAEIRASQLLQSKCPLLPQTAAVIGDVQVRNRGTIGGSMAHADPAGDMPAAVLALGADLKAVGPQGERWMKAEEFFQGLYATQLRADEVLTEIRLPATTGRKTAYRKAARRPSDFAIVGVAVSLKTAPDGSCQDLAVAVTGVSDRPYRATALETKLKGTRLTPQQIAEAAPAITAGMDVNANIHASAEFRAHLARVYFTRTLSAAQ